MSSSRHTPARPRTPSQEGRGRGGGPRVARLERGREQGSRLAVIVSHPGLPTERDATCLGFGMAYSRVVLVKPGEGLMPSP